MRKFAAFIIMICLASSLSPALAENAGGDPGEFLSFGAGARSLGMGKAFVAVADDASATYWNPAGLTLIDRPQITSLYSTLFEDTSYSFVGYAHPMSGPDSFGVNAVLLTSDNFEKVDYANKAIGTFSDQKMSVELCYARRLHSDISVGLGLKYIGRSIDEHSDSFISSDIGGIYTPTSNLSLGLVIRNAASSKMCGDTNDSFSPEFRVGAAYRMLDDDLLLSLDISRLFDAAQQFHGGIEYKLLGDKLLLRAGADAVEITGGVGVNLGDLSIDYAYAKQELGDSHRVSLSYKFGATTAKSRKDQAEEWRAKAVNAYRNGKYAEAFDDIKEALKVYPEGKDEQLLKTKLSRVLDILKKQNGVNRWGDGEVAKQLEQTAKDYLNHDLYLAKDRLEYALSQEPDNALAQDMLAMVDQTIAETGNKDESPIEKGLDKILTLFYAGEYSKVIVECKRVIAIDPTLADPYKKLGSAYYMKKNVDGAIEAWEKAVELDPKDVKLMEFLKQLKEKRMRASK